MTGRSFGHVARLHTGIDVSVTGTVDLRRAFEDLAVDVLPPAGRDHDPTGRWRPAPGPGRRAGPSPSRNWSCTLLVSRVAVGQRPQDRLTGRRCVLGQRQDLGDAAAAAGRRLRVRPPGARRRGPATATARTASSGTAPRTGCSGRTAPGRRRPSVDGAELAAADHVRADVRVADQALGDRPRGSASRARRAPHVGGLSCSRWASGWPPIFQQARYSLNG